MDYHSIHGYDVSSFATSETHRLPTISASQALNELHSRPANPISTGLKDLDDGLLGSSGDSQEPSPLGGVKRGQVTEIWGPPGAGKTALGMQLAANALHTGGSVVWVDCFHAAQPERFTAVLNAVKKAEKSTVGDETEQRCDVGKFTRYACLTLPHLMALISRPTKDSIYQNVSLVVASMATALLNSALPKMQDAKQPAHGNKGTKGHSKRMQALQFVINALQKLAATRNCAVVLLSQCATKMQSERGAALVPAVSSTVWEQGIATRVVLYREWARQENAIVSIMMAGLQKLDGKATDDYVQRASPFRVENGGVATVQYDAVGMTNILHQKRKLDQTELDLPESDDDEDYDWANEDGTPYPFPQGKFQGSEDFMGQEVGRSDEEAETEDEDGGQSASEADPSGPNNGPSAGEAPNITAELP
ncbi:P-loop containing nucleoside triphosphate hydrolase protein [Stachybotrys elegans]|uniref:P-loop containing nucleoside triphosphate hydrolase protein n=1 Tax=Stachybotrys elegans TaxID=80388 RepID=A0A8K0T3N9_9HYPO|nr:P-loop containing nucleoside triphosphate hydrolase protein [Stachybotrys elegans]